MSEPRPTDPRPTSVFDSALQHERTSLAWERTAISMMVAGLVSTRFAATAGFWWLAVGALGQVLFGSVLLVWAGVHYEELHGPLRRGADVVHPAATHLVGLAAIATTGVGLVTAILVAVRG